MMTIAMDDLVALVCDVIETDPGGIDVRSDRDQVPGWDSLAHLSIITALEERCNIRLTMAQIAEVRTIEHLSQAVNGR